MSELDKAYEDLCAKEIEKYRTLGVKASDRQFRRVFDARMLACLLEAKAAERERLASPAAFDDEGGAPPRARKGAKPIS